MNAEKEAYGSMGMRQGSAHQARVRTLSQRGSASNLANVHTTQDGTLKAAVFGFSDGLCTNVNVILGMYAAVSGGSSILHSGAQLVANTRHIICLTGICGMLGGASSMACGEWLSASAETEANKQELALERWHHETIPEVESKDMHDMMQDAGLSEATCDALVADLAKLPLEERLAFHAKFELGIEDEDVTLVSSLRNAGFMWMSFAVGGVIPLLPWLLAPTETSLLILFLLTLVVTTLAVLATSLLQSSGGDVSSRIKMTAKVFVRQTIVVALAVGVTVGLNLLLTGSVTG